MRWKTVQDITGKVIGAAVVLALFAIGISLLIKLLIYIWTS